MKLKDYVDIGKYSEHLYLTNYELLFCMAYFILALMLCIYSTPKGSVFFGDSFSYMLDGENFINKFPYYSEGPIFPFLVAIGMGFGLTSEQSTGIMPIICYSLLGFPIFLIGKIICRPVVGYLACITFLLSSKYVFYLATLGSSDMPYLFFSLLSMLFLVIHNKFGSLSSITLAGIFTLIAELTRYIGITLFFAGIIVIMTNSNKIKLNRTIVLLADYCLISIVPFITWRSISSKVYNITTSSSNPPIDVMIFKFRTVIEQIFYLDYKAIMMIIVFASSFIIISLAFKKQLIAFMKETIPLTSYVLIYSTVLILVTSSLWISVEGGILDTRKVVQIYPYIILLITFMPVFLYYNILCIRTHKIVFKAVSSILLICLLAQGANSLFLYAKETRMQSFDSSSFRDRLGSFISEFNITANDKIYCQFYYPIWAWFNIDFHMDHPNIIVGTIYNSIPGETVLDNLTPPYSPSGIGSLADLIRMNKNLPIYILVSPDTMQDYLKNTSRDISLSSPYIFPKSIMYRVELKCNKTCSTDAYSNKNYMEKLSKSHLFH